MKRIRSPFLTVLLRLVPRSKHVWITGMESGWDYENAAPVFFDNSKYFFLYLVNNTEERVYWVSTSKREIELLNRLNLPVVNYNTLKGKWIVARAKYSFHHYGENTINKLAQLGMIQINLWHGTPLKKILYDVSPKTKTKYDLIYRILDLGGEHYVSSTSTYLTNEIICRAFDVEKEQVINYGYPRTDILKLNRKDITLFCKKYSSNLLKYIEIINHRKVFLYMPTFRDDDLDYFNKANIDFDKLDKVLRENNSVFFLKLHPLTKQVNVNNYDNIICIDNDVDIYPFLVFTDYLITDYSSIFFDFLHLNREIIFIPYDLDNYISKRELYFKYNEFVPGKIYYTFDEFMDNISDIQSIDYSAKRKELYDLFNEDYNFDASQKIFRFLKDKEHTS